MVGVQQIRDEFILSRYLSTDEDYSLRSFEDSYVPGSKGGKESDTTEATLHAYMQGSFSN